MDRLE
jgi:diketogulonate reductase-like aldo/keto reductase